MCLVNDGVEGDRVECCFVRTEAINDARMREQVKVSDWPDAMATYTANLRPQTSGKLDSYGPPLPTLRNSTQLCEC